MSKVYIGLDIGRIGFIVTQKDNIKEYYSLADHDMKDIFEYLKHIKECSNDNLVCVFEDVKAIFGAGAGQTFEFGFQKGYIVGYLVALGIPYEAVLPRVWQKEMWTNADMVYKTTNRKLKNGSFAKQVDTKPTSINAAKRLFPNEDFRRTSRCKKADDNKCDALLMSEYARRKNL